MQKSEAARIIQRAFRRYLAFKNRPIKVTTVGKGIVNIRLSMTKPSKLFGKEALPLDTGKVHEVMITRVTPAEVSLVLTTNQGTPEAFVKHLKDCSAGYGAIINGGFYAINGFYELKHNQPIGLHRFEYNASISQNKDVIRKDFDNTREFFKHNKKATSKPFEEYKSKKDIDSQLHLKTQTPHSVKDQYGLFRIKLDGSADIQKMTSFSAKAFKAYLKDARYLLSSGPILVWDDQICFSKRDLKDKRYQFKQVYKHFGSHPGSVPPGTFYHADQLNPRSAIGINAKGELLMVTVKGEENPSKRDGMSLDQLALLMKLLGSKVALNLDGGYSACQGFFNQEKMVTPLFAKKVGRETLLPCAIVAKEKTTTSKNYTHKTPIISRGNVKRKLTLAFD